MTDKKLETNIRMTKTLLEMWTKLHSLYADILSRGLVTDEDESKFMESKEMVARRYAELRDMLDFKYTPHNRMTDPVADILSLRNMRLMSEKTALKLDADWKDSYVFLNSVLERLENRKRRIGGINPISLLVKRMLVRK